MLTNKQGLPEPLVAAIRNDPYNAGTGRISVTRLLQPPQIQYLMRGREVVEDAADRVWALLGQAVHTILERANKGSAIVEKRLYTEVRGWQVSGQFDVLSEGVLSDYKITSVYAREGKAEWTAQLNILRVLCERNGLPVNTLQLVAIFRDWRKGESFNHDYPQAQVGVIPVPLWPIEKAEAYLDERVRIHQLDTPPLCTDEERWAQPSKFALMMKGKKRAVRLFDVKPEIELLDGQYWEHRPGHYRRCEDYCAASQFCGQWARHLESQKQLDTEAIAF